MSYDEHGRILTEVPDARDWIGKYGLMFPSFEIQGMHFQAVRSECFSQIVNVHIGLAAQLFVRNKVLRAADQFLLGRFAVSVLKEDRDEFQGVRLRAPGASFFLRDQRQI